MRKITTVAKEAGGACLTMTFDPNVMPKSIVPSAEPMLAERALPCAVGLGRHLTEGARQQ